MAEIKFNPLLKTIIEHIREISNGGTTLMTAEKLIVSTIDLMENDNSFTEENESELMPIIELGNRSSLQQIKETLTQYISDKQNDGSLSDSLYLQKKLNEAKNAAAQQNADELSALMLFQCILSDPSKPLSQCMSQSQPAAASPQPVTWVHQPVSSSFPGMPVSVGSKPSVTKDSRSAGAIDPKAMVSALTNKVKNTQDILLSSIYGQDNAVSVFTTGYFQGELLAMTDKERKRPRATFLFAGPPGVGKTFLAEKAAETLQLPFARFDMSEYSDHQSGHDFCGSNSSYQNSKEGNVTGFVAKNPKCILLFDEVEKANLNIIHLFLQMLDAGRLRDNFTNKEVSFTDAIIILTTNAGKQLYDNAESGDFSGLSRKVILKSLQNDINPQTEAPFFPAAICSRFASGNVVMFNHIAAHDLREIAKRELLRHANNFRKEIGIDLKIDEKVFTSLLFAEGGSADARTVRGRAEAFFDSELFELFRLVDSKNTEGNISSIETINIGVELPEDDPELTALFENSSKHEALLFSSAETAAECSKKAEDIAFLNVQSVSEAEDMLKNHEISIIIVDLSFGRKNNRRYLNVEDVESTARDFLHHVYLNHSETPIYLLQTRNISFSPEEKFSFMRQGVRGILTMSEDISFAVDLENICSNLHQQSSMISLAKSNKVVTFETAQTLSHNGRQADITLFDFGMNTALDAEDSENILSSISKPNVRFDQVIGATDAKKELQYFVDYLRKPKKFIGTGARAPRGVLLYGPPGTGKTMLAKAMASESDVTFITAEGNQFIKKYLGEGQDEVHNLFRIARKYAPSILFIDEIDAIAAERGGGDSDASKSVDRVLTAFLTEMDGFNTDPKKPVFVLAATNYDVEPGGRKSLDPALMRRFDRKVYIDLPDREDRIKYIHMKISSNDAFQVSDDELENIAIRSTGRSLAELESVFELALRSAIRSGDHKVTDEVLDEAYETYLSGDGKKWDISTLERVARHEAGHAFICWHGGETPSYITIVARGDHGGYVQHGDEDKKIFTKDDLLARIRTSLGGRASELVYYGERDGISTGASGDLATATSVAQQILCTYGMDDEFGLAYIDAQSAKVGEMSSRVHSAVKNILSEQMKITVRTIRENKNIIDALVEQLLSKNHLTGNEIEAVFKEARAAKATV